MKEDVSFNPAATVSRMRQGEDEGNDEVLACGFTEMFNCCLM